ncbi:MAG: hypothetical protein ABS81_29775 [Pseudonocardia sp. SCN 72-86]|nr:MAG: hypothetical protein ABS81_29775 [Pseudonocardia sp. SCN 72-86]
MQEEEYRSSGVVAHGRHVDVEAMMIVVAAWKVPNDSMSRLSRRLQPVVCRGDLLRDMSGPRCQVRAPSAPNGSPRFRIVIHHQFPFLRGRRSAIHLCSSLPEGHVACAPAGARPASVT